MSDYLEIRATIPDDREDELAETLSRWPILGVDIIPQQAGRLDVGVWITSGDDRLTEEVRVVLNAFSPGPVRMQGHVADDWSAQWRDGLAAFEVGETWWIDPHPERATAAPAGRVRLAVEPRAAFGSGTHESTQLVLMAIEKENCRGLTILDIGTGSGVLAVAADSLGAASVVGLDTDPLAAWEARTTAHGQSWRCRPLIVAGGVGCLSDAGFDLILCNMIVAEFCPLLGDIRRLLSTTGAVIFSGILESERGVVDELLAANGLVAAGDRGLNGWISVRAEPAGRRS
jgi:ribosomal protein L11 methyltransferase